MLQTQLPDQGIDRTLTMHALDLAQDQTHGMAVVAAAERDLGADQRARLVERHGRAPSLVTARKARAYALPGRS